MKNVRNHRYIKLVTTDKQRSKLVSEPNYHTTRCFLEKLLAIKMKKTSIKMNEPVYLGLSALDISKVAIYSYRCDYVNPMYGKTAKLYYMDTNTFIVHVKSENIYADLAGDAKKRFDTFNYEVRRTLFIGKNKSNKK